MTQSGTKICREKTKEGGGVCRRAAAQSWIRDCGGDDGKGEVFTVMVGGRGREEGRGGGGRDGGRERGQKREREKRGRDGRREGGREGGRVEG